MTNIFIANLDFGITSEDLKATFSQFGEVSYAHVVYDNKTKKSKGFGYVEMEDLSQANTAIQALNGMEVNERVLDVKLATPKEKRPQTIDRPKEKFTPSTSRETRTPREPRTPRVSRESRTMNEERPARDVKTVKEVKTSERRVMRPRRKKKED
ncbi:RNA recognition motif domain-containing protein [Brumimicrobium mesophilum]|uniref:RNA recognition motif domain-containing protein n=1 Tax=Brumimicrobium mesophilum TaxID=392717 RepID=UPI000D14416E|nr:RNA-binding protein [Brumimicrobium mesophilum]